MTNKQPIEGKWLGKQTNYPQEYQPDVLVAVPRELNRTQYNIDNKNLPFVGTDAWHAYEVSFLTTNGLPVCGVIKLTYSADSLFLIESKSLKLYLNSFNMTRFENNAKESTIKACEIIKSDLSTVVGQPVSISFFDELIATKFDFSNYELLENQPSVETIEFNHFTETPELLSTDGLGSITLNISTNLLRSNCKITHQPDWGSAFIHYKGSRIPNLISILQYVVSFRNENHFHEEICEMLYKRLWDTYSPEELMVTCLYTRRGGIDICPTRASSQELLPKNLVNSSVLTAKLIRQ